MKERGVADVPAQLEAVLAGHYAIERPLGSGGMATVYLARDLRHDREVALKVVRPDLAAALGTDRFLREIRITAQLNHPHILPLLDSGGEGDVLYYVMPYASGGSLRRRLVTERTISLANTVRIVRDVATALEHAHRHGVVHRDIKPENILFSEGLPVVADFGIARAVSAAGEGLTRSGFPLGTPGYMSPEQAAGAPDLDERTDVCGLACVAYEMLIGETPGMWATPDEVRVGRFLEITATHRERLDRLPGRAEQVLTQGLAIRPAQRYDSTVAFADGLAGAAEPGARLDDEQVHEVLRRAAALDATHETAGGFLSIGAVEQAAAQVGIPPERVREAVRELGPSAAAAAPPAATAGGLTPILGRIPKEEFDQRSRTITVDRHVAAEAHPGEFEALVAEIQRTLGVPGHASTFGRSLTWSSAAQGTTGRHVLVSVTTGAGRTRIHVEEKLELTGFRKAAPGLAAGLGFILSTGVLAGLQRNPAALLLMLVFAGGAAYLTYLGVTIGAVYQRLPQHRLLADRLAAAITRGALPPP
jgi:hypothetical protein